MKKSGICLWIILVLAVACTKSRFATTTRHYHDGKVVYANHYSNERRNLNRPKIKHIATQTRDAPAKTAVKPLHQPGAVPAMGLITSSGNNPAVYNNMKQSVATPGNNSTGHTNARNLAASSDDPVAVDDDPKNLAGPRTGTANPEFRSGKEVTPVNPRGAAIKPPPAKGYFKEMARAGDTSLNKAGNGKDKAAGKGGAAGPKTEKFGLAGFILSFFGIVPLIGIPFAILAIIFGAKSLGRIKRNPGKYKRICHGQHRDRVPDDRGQHHHVDHHY
jgi:hypothetical protein